MNEFKETIKAEVNNNTANSCKTDRIKQIDEKISANIAKILLDMSRNIESKSDRLQILDRMLNINKIFEKGFDNQIKILAKEETEKFDKDDK